MPMYLLYKVIRCLYVSLWFYCGPFVAMTLQFIIPFYVVMDDKEENLSNDGQ